MYFPSEPPLNPPSDWFEDYYLPHESKARIFQICEDIILKGEKTIYNDVYDTLYQIVEEEIYEEYEREGE